MRKYIEKYSNHFDESVNAALEKILDCEQIDGFTLFQYENGVVTITVDSGDAFEQRLLFQDTVFSEGFDISLCPYAFELHEAGTGYRLEFIQNDAKGTRHRHSLQFSVVNAEIICFNYTKSITCDFEPWRAVANYLYEMKSKRDRVGSEFLNEVEKRLLPLAEFGPLVRFFSIGMESDNSKAAIEIFISYADRAHAADIISLAKKYWRSGDCQVKKTISKKLQKAMVNAGSEPLYRMILGDIKSSAALYPDKIDNSGAQYFAELMRERIISFFYSQGFQGEYPYFRKMSALRGLRFLYIGRQLAALWNEKHMASYIDCYEEYVHGEFSIHFVAGTIFLKGDQVSRFPSLTADSGFFIDKDRRRARAVLSNAYWEIGQSSIEEETLKAAKVASRLAQCAKITQEERKKYLSLSIESWQLLFLLWILGGSFFGIMLCAGFAVMELFLGLVFTGSWPRTWQLIRDTPWLVTFIFGGVGFGLAMFICSLIGRKRG